MNVSRWAHGSDRLSLGLGGGRARLETIVADRNRAQKHMARARIILGSADRLSVAEVALHDQDNDVRIFVVQPRVQCAVVELVNPMASASDATPSALMGSSMVLMSPPSPVSGPSTEVA